MLAAGSGYAEDDAKARLAAGFMLDAIAPTNFFFTNPAAIKRAMETGGVSVAAGARKFVDDLLNNGGRPRQVDARPFRVGVNLAATPGKIVFKNDLMELIQYAPQTAEVRAVPLLASPPWINKYYVMDLAPGRSFIEWAVQHERTVFAISYRNPDSSMGGVTLDDYLIHGPREALDVIGEITGSPQDRHRSRAVPRRGADRHAGRSTWRRRATTGSGRDHAAQHAATDYSEPGILGAFTDATKTVERLERQMARTGILEGSQMAGTFDILRANDLIFNYVVSNWLMGQDPPAFDILAWNGDSTRMPAAMHSFYLRSLYMRNELARGELELAGQRLSLGSVTNDVYVVGAINDHIVPWHSSYKTGALMGGAVRYVLSSGGHIAGIVNPPGPKAWYEAGESAGGDPEAWRSANSKHRGSWWEDWAAWSDPRAGERIAPPGLGSRKAPSPRRRAAGGIRARLIRYGGTTPWPT